MLYLLFFLLRDEDALSKRIRDAIPLHTEQQRAFLLKFTTVIRATVKGDMLVALLQGTLGGLIFWFLGISAPLLWAVVMAFFSLLPAIGAGLIWIPVAVYLLASGAIWQGVFLIAFGALIIGLADNFLRPILVGKDTKMPDYVVLISTLGGIATFGLNGFVIGPVIAAMFIAAWTSSRHQGNALRTTAAFAESKPPILVSLNADISKAPTGPKSCPRSQVSVQPQRRQNPENCAAAFSNLSAISAYFHWIYDKRARRTPGTPVHRPRIGTRAASR